MRLKAGNESRIQMRFNRMFLSKNYFFQSQIGEMNTEIVLQLFHSRRDLDKIKCC